MKKMFFFCILAALCGMIAAQTAGDYRSMQSGNWTSISTWEIYDGSQWNNAASAPNSSSGVVSILNGHTVTISSTLTIDQTFVDAGGTLTVDLSSSESLIINNGSGDDLTVNGTLNLNDVVSNGGNGLTGSGKTVINGICNWNSGHITSTDFNIASGGVMNMTGSGECRINWDGVVYNAGTVNFAKTGVAFVMYYNGTFNNLEGGVFEASTNESIYYRQDLSPYNTPVFNNAGTFRKETGTGTTTVYKVTFNNSGTVDVQTGTLKFHGIGGSGTHSGTFTIASGAKILSEHYTQYFSEGSEINGEGEFETVNSNNCNMTGTTNGTSIGSDLTFKLSGNSTLNGVGKLRVNGTFEWTSTGLIEVWAFIISQGANLNISGDNQKTFRAYPHGTNKIYNYGTITWTDTGAIGGYGQINNISTGVIDIQNNATLDASSGSWTVINDGLIKKSAGTGTSRFGANLTNNGTLRIETGTLDLYYSTLTNYDHNSGHPWLNGGVYDLQGKFKFNTNYDVPIEVNNAEIILDGSESGILLFDGSSALANLAAITTPGKLTLKNGRDFSSGAAAFTNSGTLDCGTNVFSNSGNFTNADNAWLIIGSPDGITSSGSSGNIQSSGTRIFHTGGNYKYNGTSPQVTGSGLPGTVRELKIENPAGVTLTSSAIVASHLTLTEGALSTGSNTLKLGSSAGSVGTLTCTEGKIIGTLQRWIADATANDIIFPIGTSDHKRTINISFTSAPTTGGTLTAEFFDDNPGASGLPLNDQDTEIVSILPDGYWSISAADGLTGGSYDLALSADGFTHFAYHTSLHLLKRTDENSNWILDGTHSQSAGSNQHPVIHRIGLTGFSDFGIGTSEEIPSLPTAGSGTSGDPYQIATLENLYWLTAPDSIISVPDQAARWSSHYIQTNDIDASPTQLWFPNGQGGFSGWSPIGGWSDIHGYIYFSGSYDGDGYTISDLYIDRPISYLGLFGLTTATSSITNLGLIDVDLTCSNVNALCTGAIVGQCFGQIDNCYASGVINGKGRTGGLVGELHTDGTITNSYTAGTISGDAGGLVGLNRGTITDSYSTADLMNSSDDKGGFVASNYGTIDNCFASGFVSGGGNGNAGGFVNYNTGTITNSHATGEVIPFGIRSGGGFAAVNSGGTISDCYATGNVTSGVAGGFIGTQQSAGTAENCFATGNVTNPSSWNDKYAGGFIGVNWTGCSISDCYSRGNVIRDHTQESAILGGFIGKNHQGIITNSFSTGFVAYNDAANPTDKGFAGGVDTGGAYSMSGNYWDMDTSNQAATAGDAEGRSTSNMTYPYSIDTYVNWDFTDIWAEDTDYSINDGYAILQWQADIPVVPATPQNIVISIADGNVTITWDAVTEATSYKVYSSDDPETGFAEDTTGTFTDESWTAPASDAKKFYKVTAVE